MDPARHTMNLKNQLLAHGYTFGVTQAKEQLILQFGLTLRYRLILKEIEPYGTAYNNIA